MTAVAVPKAGPLPQHAPPPRHPSLASHPVGACARALAICLLERILFHGIPWRDASEEPAQIRARGRLSGQDQRLRDALTGLSLRNYGALAHIVQTRLHRADAPIAPLTWAALIVGACQVCVMNSIPAHAAVDTTVAALESLGTRGASRGFVNAILRGLLRRPVDIESLPPALWFPRDVFERWQQLYGTVACLAFCRQLRSQPPLDLTLANTECPPAIPGSRSLFPPSCRVNAFAGKIESLPGYASGGWWVQDISACLPVALLGRMKGLRVADLCAAPGGKTAQACAAGAQVTAVDHDPGRIRRLRANLDRLGYTAQCQTESVFSFCENAHNRGRFDAVILDPPCSATGTFRHNPDVLWRGRASLHVSPRQPHREQRRTPPNAQAAIARLAALQHSMTTRAATLLKPGGRLVYSVCSLEPEEGERHLFLQSQIREKTRARATHSWSFPLSLDPITPDEAAPFSGVCRRKGTLRVHPGLLEADGGCDGFFIARFTRNPNRIHPVTNGKTTFGQPLNAQPVRRKP